MLLGSLILCKSLTCKVSTLGVSQQHQLGRWCHRSQLLVRLNGLDFSFKSWRYLTQTCSAKCPVAYYDILSPQCDFQTKANIWDISIFLSPRLLSQLHVLYGIWYPLWIFEMNTDIWDILISTPPYPYACSTAPWENRSSIIVIISCLNHPKPPRTLQIVLFRWKEMWHFQLHCHRWKIEWRLSVERSNWNGSMVSSGEALKNQLH